MDVEIKIPDIGLDEAEVTEILVQLGDQVELEQSLITIEGDKTSIEIPSPISGIVKSIYVKIGDKIKTSSLIMIFNTENVTFNKLNKSVHSVKQEKLSSVNYMPQDFQENNLVHATPVIRRLARTLNVDLKNIVGTGPKNRILKEDLDLYRNKKNFNNVQKKQDELKEKEVELSKIQKITANNLHNNWINIPHVTQFDEVSIDKLEEFRQKYNNDNKNSNITILVFILKIVAFALEKFPIFNSSLHASNKKIILKEYINIGFAVNVQSGLLVPVIKDVNKKNITELSSELISLSKKAREGKLNSSDIKNGCFTISNLGGIGGGWFSPIINAPEVAILGVSKTQIKPFWDGNQFIPSCILPLSLSYDHRVINGADAAHFITFISKLLSDIHFLFM